MEDEIELEVLEDGEGENMKKSYSLFEKQEQLGEIVYVRTQPFQSKETWQKRLDEHQNQLNLIGRALDKIDELETNN